MNIECSQCGSTEFTKLSLIYSEGFSDLKARSRGWGLLIGSGGPDLGFGKFKTRGEIQTKLSQSVSPPHKWSYWKIIFGGLIGLLVLEFFLGYIDPFLHYGGNFNEQLTAFGYTWLGVIAIVLCVVFWHNVWQVPKRYRLWNSSFMCRRCGHVLQLPGPRDSASQAVFRDAHPSS